jgi:DNA-binding GntR family transcriptional regulator
MKKARNDQQGNVQDSVYTALRESIINLNLLPGTVISENEISLKYQVSRTPVREAFIYLSREGLVHVIPQRETLVSRIDFNRVEQELFLRESLEMAALQPFISRCRSAHIGKMEEIVENQVRAAENNEYINFLNYDDMFHQVFFEAAGYDLGWKVLESMCGHYRRVRLLTVLINGIAWNIVSQHKAIILAVKRNDLQDIRTKLDAHLHKLDAEEKILRERFPNYFLSFPEENTFEVDFGGFPVLS